MESHHCQNEITKVVIIAYPVSDFSTVLQPSQIESSTNSVRLRAVTVHVTLVLTAVVKGVSIRQLNNIH